MIRWHGSTIGIGFRFMIVPTARAAFGLPERVRELRVRGRLAEGDARQLHQHALAERRHAAKVDREVERVAPSCEVLVELASCLLHLPRGAQHAAAREPRELLDVVLGVGVEGDAQQAAVGGCDEQLADRGVDDVVAGVEHARPYGCLPEAAVELGGNGHRICSFLRRRTPAEAAWRAASGLESSAAAICSYVRS